ncbi:hypothetical protein B807_879 [Fructilactobacillus florum 2F]|nr:hypothetical protein B807_879 [Fructilactobacillus florum 2F]
MLRWSAVRLAGQPWIGKLVDFQLIEPQNSPKRQVRTTKIHSHQPGRSVRH